MTSNYNQPGRLVRPPVISETGVVFLILCGGVFFILNLYRDLPIAFHNAAGSGNRRLSAAYPRVLLPHDLANRHETPAKRRNLAPDSDFEGARPERRRNGVGAQCRCTRI